MYKRQRQHDGEARLADDLECSANAVRLAQSPPGGGEAGAAGGEPDGGLTHLLPQSIGVPAAMRWLNAGAAVGAAEAHRLGMSALIVAPSSLQDSALALAWGVLPAVRPLQWATA